MQDIKEQIKILFLKYYNPSGDVASYLSTSEIYRMLRGIIPSQPITEYDIYDVMKEMDFEQELVVRAEKEKIFEGDDSEGTTDEFDENEKERIFLWKVFEK